MKKWIFALSIVAWICGCAETNQLEDGTVIVCTTGMIADAADRFTTGCNVYSLMGPGTDPHLFKPSKESLDLLQRADVIIANGLHLEGRMQDILETLSRRKPVIFVGEFAEGAENGAISAKLIYADTRGTVPDPHIWFDVSMWKQAMAYTASELKAAVPRCVNQEGVQTYLSALDSLHEHVVSSIQEIPEQQRVLITAHDAFSYFGRAYGVEVLALQGISTAAEYGVRDVTDMIDLITDRRIKAIFDESALSPRSVEAVVAGCENRGFTLARGGTLYSDALGGPGSGAETYRDMVRHNVETIKNALK